MRILKEDYAKKIAMASPLQLVVINFELVLDFLDDAKTDIEFDNDAEFQKNIKKAHDFLKELIYSLNMDYEISADLYDIYIYINKLFVSGIYRKDTEAIDQVCRILTVLLEGFKMIEENDSIDRMSKIFAGLTYNSKGELAEYIDIQNENDYKI